MHCYLIMIAFVAGNTFCCCCCCQWMFGFSVCSFSCFSSVFFFWVLFVRSTQRPYREASAHPATTALRTLSDRDWLKRDQPARVWDFRGSVLKNLYFHDRSDHLLLHLISHYVLNRETAKNVISVDIVLSVCLLSLLPMLWIKLKAADHCREPLPYGQWNQRQ